MKQKLKKCARCGLDKYIWSNGKCQGCSNMAAKAPKMASKPLSPSKGLRTSKKVIEARREGRKGYGEFYMKHVDIIKHERRCCSECGSKLQGDVSEVAHLLPKGTKNYKSIATEDLNVIYLCSWLGPKNCHQKFDESSIEDVKSMEIYEIVVSRVKELIEKFNIRLTLKDQEKYEG